MNDYIYNNNKDKFKEITGHEADENVVAYLTYLNALKLEEIKSQITDFMAKNG